MIMRHPGIRSFSCYWNIFSCIFA